MKNLYLHFKSVNSPLQLMPNLSQKFIHPDIPTLPLIPKTSELPKIHDN